MKILSIASLALLTTSPALDQVQVRSVEIVRYGIYTAELRSSARDNQGVQENISTNFRRADATTTIPAQSGVRFGIEFKVIGAPANKSVSLKKVVVFPAAGLHSPAIPETLYRNETTADATVGEITYAGYKFDDPWELVPGPWSIQLWYGGRMLAEQKFTVSAP
ncbi:MAG TPA: DUF3859 domain-containing protein [Xanthobacteraceae bacterium]|jgi:hypothetical protein